MEQAFHLFDDNGDALLTVAEIRAGFRDQQLDGVLDTEIDALVKAIDRDANGVVSLPEWTATLKPRLEVEQDFRMIMGEIASDDPIELEEKTLDLKFRSQRLESELMVLRKTNNGIGNRVMRGSGNQGMQQALQRAMAGKIKSLESQLVAKKAEAKTEKQEIEDKIKASLMAKDQVY